jgi:DNA-binding CsgD family transcriptional regulator
MKLDIVVLLRYKVIWDSLYIDSDVIKLQHAIREMRDLHCDIEIDGYHESFQGREIQILFLMARGASKTEIADIIYISVNTVRWYARQIYVKLDVRWRGEAVQAAWRLGLIGRRNGKSKPRNT